MEIDILTTDASDLDIEDVTNPPELNRENFVKLCAVVTDLVETRMDQLDSISQELNDLENRIMELESADQVSKNVDELHEHVQRIARIVSAYRVEASQINL